MEYLIQIITTLPFIGDLSVFLGDLPGDGALESILLNGPALLFAIGVRNLSYIFEKTDYLKEEAQLWKPNRYTGYLLLTWIGHGFLLVVIITVIQAG